MGDLVYAFSCSGIVFAFDTATGALRWTYDTKLEDGSQSTFHGEPVQAGMLYAYQRE